MKRALLVTRNLPPLVGGMERLVWHIADELSEQYQVHVVGPAGCGAHLPRGIYATEIPLRPTLLYLFRTMLAAFRQALSIHPHIVFAGSGLTAPFAWLAARASGARCIVYLHGLDIETHHPLYRFLWHPFFRRCDRVLVNSHFTRELALAAGINPDRLAVLHPGVDKAILADAAHRRAVFRERLGVGSSPLMLYVGRITARKGLAVFVRDIFPHILASRPDARLVVVGDEPKGALLKTDGQRAQIDASLTQTGTDRYVYFLGELAQDDPVIGDAYFAADVMIFPVQDKPGDHEGFGMVAVEAAAHGLPTVAFASGGVTDAVCDGVSGRLVSGGDNAGFADAVSDILGSKSDGKILSVERCVAFANDFTWSTFGESLRRLVD